MNFHQKPVTFVGQVDLKVEDFERSLAFYKEIIGFQVLEQTERSARLTADGKTTLLTIEQPDDIVPQQPRTTGLYHYALLLPSRSDLAHAVRHLYEHGYRFGSSDHLVSEALYLSDPDGNGIEIYTDRPPSTWTWRDDQVTMTVDPLNFEDLLAEGREGSWAGLPAGTVMGHIHLHVSNLTEAVQFYGQGLGFDVVAHLGDQASFVSTGRYHHHIGLNTWAGVGAPAPAQNSVGLKNFTIEYPSEEARAKVVEQLNDMGAVVKEGKDVFQTEDPAGNAILLHVNEG